MVLPTFSLDSPKTSGADADLEQHNNKTTFDDVVRVIMVQQRYLFTQ